MAEENSGSILAQVADSRRSFLRKGALASGAAVVGLGGLGIVDSDADPAGPAAAQEGTETPNGTDAPDGTETPDGTATPLGTETPERNAAMFVDEFHQGAQFRVKSPVIEENPDLLGAEQGTVFTEYNTRVVEYLNTDEDVYFFPADDADVQQGQVYELHDDFGVLDGEVNGSGVIDVTFTAVPAEDVLIPQRDNQLEPLDDFDLLSGGGKALVQSSDFHAGALVRITSGVVEWTPRPDVAGSDVFSVYNTRHARYLNTGDEFRIYTAQEGEFEPGAVYLVRDEFDVTDPEGQLVTADLDRVDEDDLAEDLLTFD